MSSPREDEESTFECVLCGHVWKAKESQPCPRCKNPVAIVWDKMGAVGWGRSFFLALLSLIVGFLFASIWFILYILIKYQLFIHFRAPYYEGFFFTESVDWGWLILDAILSVASPFLSFRYVPYSQGNQFSLPFTIDSPLFGLIGLFFGQFFNIVDIIEILVRFVISFLVYASFFVPIIKFCLSETKRSISWLKALILGIKSAIVGIILSTLFLFLGGLFLMAVFFGLSSGSTGSPQPSPPDLNMVIALVFFVLIVVTIIAVFVYTATGATIIRYTTKEASRVRKGSSWGRSFLVSLKANIVAILWELLFGLVFGIFAVAAIAGSIQSRSLYALGESIFAIFVFLIIVIILSELSPTASIIKYLVEEIDKNLEREKAELKLEQKPGELSKDFPELATGPVKASVKKRSLKGKNCGDCSHYLTSKCPRNYSRDDPVWRMQKPCELFEQNRPSS